MTRRSCVVSRFPRKAQKRATQRMMQPAADYSTMSMNTKEGDEMNSDTLLRVLGISGSLRKASFNSGLLRAAQEVAPERMEITIFDIIDLPLYNGDVEAQGDPASVVALKLAIRGADAVLFATPEYNWSISGALKNAIDWASRDGEEESLMGKPATIIGAGGRAGTARAQMQLREILAELGSVVMVKPGVLVQAFSPRAVRLRRKLG